MRLHLGEGALAEPFDPGSLAEAIRWVLDDPQRRHQLGTSARIRAERLWNPERVAGLYGEVYRQALEQAGQGLSATPSLR